MPKNSLQIEKENALKDWIRKQNFRGPNGKFRKPSEIELAKFSAEWDRSHPIKPKSETLLAKLERQARQRKLEKHSTESYNWFRDTVRAMGGEKTRSTIMKDARSSKRLKNEPMIGKMYTYVYDAKHKEKLPYWDAFPLIFMIGPAENGFYGVNLHYLSPKYRAILFDKLLEVRNNTKINSNTKLKISYQILKATEQFNLFAPCFKHYLFSHLQSKLALIPAEQWEAAVFLPTANFQKSNNSKVWSDSILKLR